jgi:regulatory protein
MDQKLTPDQALQKIKSFCAYQERCHMEVKQKLYIFGLYKIDVDKIIAQLIDENFLNEERFAIAFAGGKFRINQWGKVKIKYELQQKGISNYCISLALKNIDEEDYSITINKLTKAKWISLKKEQYIVREHKTKNYLIQKGYEHSLIDAAIKLLKSN